MIEKRGKHLYRSSGIIFSTVELRNILNASRSNPKHFTWIRILLHFGLKIDELISLRRDDVDLKNRILTVRAADGKSIRTLDIPLCLWNDFWNSASGKTDEEYLFPGRNGRLHRKTVQKMIRKLEILTGLKITLAKIRQTIAVRLYQNGVSISFIASFFGFRSLQAARRLIVVEVKPPAVKRIFIEEIMDLGA
ncbi:site-specific integrase [Leptospira gomenensis]|uniref:Site-specific integrase n=1 Tax=Leptospira gomenensis TaxID=2484974 RepID=A0A5F1YXR4_9LEPT|nr:tyrosine-type recombinase/integrase [Leptospira gomenensis]TGK34978.1 site-specific integrase [Leptospira gomenensis]TGK36773.1 site-specific integrase [Leptospira gomenensis]TGK48821.1 site-specific integrase [Leptospira gomenensis]TGK64587.1 site-specific integrase [Leptospira gomenensis]